MLPQDNWKILQYLRHPTASCIRRYFSGGDCIIVPVCRFRTHPFWAYDHHFYFNEWFGNDIRQEYRILHSLGYDFDKDEDDPTNQEIYEWYEWLEHLRDTAHIRHASFAFGDGCGVVYYPRYF